MSAAQAECISYLIQKYEVSAEFADITPWSPIAVYRAAQRVVIDFPVYVPATTYNPNDVVINAGNGYVCTDTTTGAFDVTKWALLGAQNAVYYGALPFPMFNIYSNYVVGDKAYWNGNVYTCKIATIQISHEGLLQAGTYQNAPLPNVFPDNQVFGVAYWGDPVPQLILPGTLPTDTAAWTLGDNRDQQMVLYMIDITLYHVHKRISPRNIPDLRVKAYDDAKQWLRYCANGDVTPALPVKQPRQGGRIRYGGNVKRVNSY
ncbi:hypothetical protein F0L74_09840 [Chitinophaga agrisoli]|uniref:Uncharacterized protein n=1 Tax=Chitinophaga agrisoli TaxID=2607653 RepID=A0A5B2VVV0_9BACT|nr:hypothetical protein [Chitinophaga agrisoli]KAA2242820.1 hypothetical protein F0L74_09840 [Chitinophaga agrisoli]